MQTKPKANSVITHEVSGDVITFHVKQAGDVVLDMSRVSEACRERAAIHGFIQRISDGAAMSRNPETGQPATPEEKMARMAALAEHYMSGTSDWSMRREGGIGAEGGLLFRALSKLYPNKTAEELKAFLEGVSTKERAALMVSPKVKPIVDELRSAAVGNIDAEDILAKL